jgi:N-acetyl-gamma-glutamyl-phosphate reductase
MMNQIRVAIIGAGGYTGQELNRLLAQHPVVRLEALLSHTYAGRSFIFGCPETTGLTQSAASP